MELDKKLQDEIDVYNELVEDEHKAEQHILSVRKSKDVQFGRVRAIKELYEEELKNASIAASSNGSNNTKQSSDTADDSPLVEKDATH